MLCDVEISGDMDGIQTAELISERHGLPVVFMTAHSDEETLERAKTTDPSGYVIKPVQERQLYTAIQLAMKDKASIGRAVGLLLGGIVLVDALAVSTVSLPAAIAFVVAFPVVRWWQRIIAPT